MLIPLGRNFSFRLNIDFFFHPHVLNYSKGAHPRKCEDEKIKEYLKSDELSTNEKKWLFKMRTRMCPNKTNFEGQNRFT